MKAIVTYFDGESNLSVELDFPLVFKRDEVGNQYLGNFETYALFNNDIISIDVKPEEEVVFTKEKLDAMEKHLDVVLSEDFPVKSLTQQILEVWPTVDTSTPAREAVDLNGAAGTLTSKLPKEKLYTRQEMFDATQNAFLWAMDDTDEAVKEEHKLWFDQKFPI